jgi:hypothetical protein
MGARQEQRKRHHRSREPCRKAKKNSVFFCGERRRSSQQTRSIAIGTRPDRDTCYLSGPDRRNQQRSGRSELQPRTETDLAGGAGASRCRRPLGQGPGDGAGDQEARGGDDDRRTMASNWDGRERDQQQSGLPCREQSRMRQTNPPRCQTAGRRDRGKAAAAGVEGRRPEER